MVRITRSREMKCLPSPLKAYALLATSADKGAVRDKALLDKLVPIDMPRLPVEPTAILYWPKKARALSLCSSAGRPCSP